ncbi:MAG: short chain dehydrogenase [Pseudomonadota bacterium]
MRVLVIGAAGATGQAACAALGHHDLIRAGRRSGDVQVDMADDAAVKALLARLAPLEAVVSCAGDATFAPLAQQDADAMRLGLAQKVMGQVNLVLAGQHVLPPCGSFTLTSGILDREPVPCGTGAALANGALTGFVRSAAIELRQRINVVSPAVLEASLPRYGHLFPGHRPVSDAEVGRAYVRAVDGPQTGQVIVV